ncbi:MAG: type I methionyl aminopeptidase [Ktedonobacterales bacterium]|nr:type I methionyl aminopeptidase [Ktedonobacterales bacterium]
MAISYRGKTEIAGIQRASQAVMEILELLRAAVRPGVTTGALDALAAHELTVRGAISNFKGYSPRPGVPPFPGVICASVNEEIVHGIPGKRALREGDIITLDFGAIVDGWHGDSALTVPVGTVAPEVARLLAVTREALRRGIAQARAGNRVFDISRAIQTYVEGEGYGVVREYTGHGIGRALHEEPTVPNYVDPRIANPLLRPGMVICVEPMVTAGGAATRELRDHWTVVTADGRPAAHFEQTVAITSDAPELLTTL